MHTDLATIRNEGGSHKLYNKTRCAKELLEALGAAHLITKVTLAPPQLPATAQGASGVSSTAVEELKTEIQSLKNTVASQGTRVAGHLTQSLAYCFPVQVLLHSLYHFRRVYYTS